MSRNLSRVVLVLSLLLCISPHVHSVVLLLEKDVNDIDVILANRYDGIMPPKLDPTQEEAVDTSNASSLRKRKMVNKVCQPSQQVEPLPGKKGLGTSFRPEMKEESLRRMRILKPSWNFSWNLFRIDEQPEDVEFVPMLWGATGGAERLRQRISRHILPDFQQGRVKRLIPFQSPDKANQSNLDVDAVADYWNTLASFGIPLTSPTTANFMGSWMQQFFDRVSSDCLRIDVGALQWYGPPDTDAFQKEMINAYDRLGKRPLLITELAVTDPQAKTVDENQWKPDQVMQFAKVILPWLEKQDWIAGYAWMSLDIDSPEGTCSSLFDAAGDLTPLGKYYQSISPDSPEGDLSLQATNLKDQIALSTLEPETYSPISAPSSVPSSSPTKCNEPLPIPPMPGKKGIGLVLNNPDTLRLHLDRIRKLNLKWNYSWNSELIDEQPDEIEFIPMIWGAWGEAGVRRRLEKDILPHYKRGKVKRLLAFNEPDVKFQSNLSVDQVVGYWPLLENAKMPLATPSVGHALGDWMVDFMGRVESDCLRAEYVAVHWYKNPNVEQFKRDMTETYYRYGQRPILITEFAPTDWNAKTPEQNRHSPEEVLDFAKEVLPWLERESFIAGYAWFPFKPSFAPGTSSALFDDDRSETLTPLGAFYASVTPSNPDGDQSIV